MRDEILSALNTIECEHDCRVLYACESGSRAWGFASPDSDYDVRLIYVHPTDWYLRLEQQSDTIDQMLPGDLDVSGWELRKMLRLFASCNLALNEWLGSPVIYSCNEKFYRRLCDLIPRYFNPKKAAFHYLGMAEKTAELHLVGDDINIKKLFYIIRPLLAVAWIAEFRQMPPTEFDKLLATDIIPGSIREQITRLHADKQLAKEGDQVSIPTELLQWVTGCRESGPSLAESLSGPTRKDWSPLNHLFQEFVDGLA